MKITFKIRKKSNLFFFVQNLSEWHYSDRNKYNQEWLRIGGPLSSKEKKGILDLKMIFRKYNFYNIESLEAANVFDYFFRYEELKNKKSSISNEEVIKCQKCLKMFEKRFEKIWKIESENLENIKKILEVEFKESLNPVINDLKILFKDVNTDININAYLLISVGPYGGGGGANIGPNRITLECSSLKKSYINNELSILWHEISHVLLKSHSKEFCEAFNKAKKPIWLNNIVKKTKFDYPKELFLSSFFTNMSYLTDKHFATDISKQLKEAVRLNNKEWLKRPKHEFPMFLIYLNGQKIADYLENVKPMILYKLSKQFIENHTKAKDFLK